MKVATCLVLSMLIASSMTACVAEALKDVSQKQEKMDGVTILTTPKTQADGTGACQKVWNTNGGKCVDIEPKDFKTYMKALVGNRVRNQGSCIKNLAQGVGVV